MRALGRSGRSGRWGVRAIAFAAAIAVLGARPREARAFCGFYVAGSNERLLNNATQVALMRQGLRTVLTMSNHYQGPPQDFAMVVPVPVVLQRENVRTLPHNVFDHLDQLTAPRLVEYWERDPCAPPEIEYEGRRRAGGGGMPMSQGMARERDSLGVRIEAQFTVGEYQIVVLSAQESNGLETWLRRERYNIPQGAAELLAPYVRDQWKFFVARVDITRVQRDPNGGARLSPLRFHYDATEFRLPVRLGLLNAPDAQDLIVYTLHPSARFEVANYRNVFIPTNLDVRDEVRTQFPGFYGQLFDATLASAGARAVVTEYAWATSSCDPCPTPPLDASEITTLGGDVLGGGASPYSMVVTRMHTRYNRATLTEDLVFREAAGVVGGRELATGPGGQLEQGALPSPQMNNFQARYAIRHAWTGAVACASPRRGVWGGPPAGQTTPGPMAARNLATAPRGAMNLPAVVLTATPGVDLNARLPMAAAATVVTTTPGPSGPTSTSAPRPATSAPTARGCACTAGVGSPASALFSFAALGVAAGLIAARRSARRRP